MYLYQILSLTNKKTSQKSNTIFKKIFRSNKILSSFGAIFDPSMWVSDRLNEHVSYTK